MYIKGIINDILFPVIKLFRPEDSFIFNGNKYNYFIHKSSWNTERVVEIPIILDYLIQYMSGKGRVLEFGNVLQQFVVCENTWDVLDKYSEGRNIIHEDIVNFKPNEKYDLVVSISTLEHVGFNEDVEVIGHSVDKIESDKINRALKNIKGNCLNPDGKMIFTMPIGYNFFMDREIYINNLRFDSVYFMKRISKNNRWKEIDYEELDLPNIKYDYPYNNANYICIGTYENTT